MNAILPLPEASTSARFDDVAAPDRPRVLFAPPGRLRLQLATPRQREMIYQLRHEVYAQELGQHPLNPQGRLTDALDKFNHYLVALLDGELAGFISLTPPGRDRYSLDKYVARERLPFAFDAQLYEVRILTVIKPHRGQPVAAALMYAAFRWIEAHGGTHLIALGRREVLSVYLKAGLEPVGITIQSGAVTFEVLHTTTAALRAGLERFDGMLDKLERQIDWRLEFSFHQPAPCFHGGAFFAAIGDEFEALDRRHAIINADVLDAWFPPSPKVVEALAAHLPWLLQTSPPTGGDGLVRTIAQTRGVAPASVLPGAGSSALIFLAFRHWLTRDSRVLILDPTYGEYAHVLEKVIRCRVDRLTLVRENCFDVDHAQLAAALDKDYDLIVLVNPNSPTGRHLPREALVRLLSSAATTGRVWIDETYIEYAGAGESLEFFAAQSENVVVCKSMSKVYALSGARAAYLCAAPHQLEELRSLTPPWAVSLPAQVAAVHALRDPDYYAARYRETAGLREELAAELRALKIEVLPGVANFVLGFLPSNGPTAAKIVKRCRAHGVFLRDASTMGVRLGAHALRVAVKDRPANAKIVAALRSVLHG